MHAIHPAPDPRHPVTEIDLIAEDLARARARAQRVQRRRHDRGRGLLVVEERQRRHGEDDEEDRERAQPVRGEGGGERRQGAVGAAGHEGTGVWRGGGDEGAVVLGVGVGFSAEEEE